jgi:hypothetical protein
MRIPFFADSVRPASPDESVGNPCLLEEGLTSGSCRRDARRSTMVSMDPERTELTWTFTPADLFEAPYEGTQPGAQLSITDGKAIVTVSGSQPVQPVEEELKQWVLGVLRVRSIQTGRSFELRGNPAAAEFKNSKSNIFVRVEPAVIRMTAES